MFLLRMRETVKKVWEAGGGVGETNIEKVLILFSFVLGRALDMLRQQLDRKGIQV